MYSGVNVAGKLVRVEIYWAVSIANIFECTSRPFLHNFNIVLLVAKQLNIYLNLAVNVLHLVAC